MVSCVYYSGGEDIPFGYVRLPIFMTGHSAPAVINATAEPAWGDDFNYCDPDLSRRRGAPEDGRMLAGALKSNTWPLRW